MLEKLHSLSLGDRAELSSDSDVEFLGEFRVHSEHQKSAVQSLAAGSGQSSAASSSSDVMVNKKKVMKRNNSNKKHNEDEQINSNRNKNITTNNNNKKVPKKGYKGVKNSKTFKGRNNGGYELQQSQDGDVMMSGSGGQSSQLDKSVGQQMGTDVETDSD